MKTPLVLDLIIPVYNNKKGLISTILSFGDFSILEDWKINILIVDDCSTVDTYEDIPGRFQDFYNIKVLKTPKNGGPGAARQHGVENTSGDYIMFIDAGDYITTFQSFCYYLSLVKNNPQVYMFSAAQEEGYADFTVDYITPDHNRIHGKIYKRNFLKQYNITFPKDIISLNEDIGFNSCCRLICEDRTIKDNFNYLIEYEPVIITQTYDANSITRKDDYNFNTLQNKGLGPHMIHALTVAMENDVDFDLIETRAYDSFMYQYLYHYWALYKKQNVQESFEGCLYFYTHFMSKYPINQQKFIRTYNQYIRDTYSNIDDPNNLYLQTIPTFNVLDFLNMLEQEKVKREAL